VGQNSLLSMTAPMKKAENHRLGRFARNVDMWSIAFFLLAGSWIWLVVEPALQYHTFAPVFFTTGRFFREFLTFPGGLLDYATAFLLQFYKFSWLGGCLTTGLGVIVFVSTRVLVNRAGWKEPRIIAWFPLALLLVAQSQYATPWFSKVLGVVAATALAALYVVLGEEFKWRCFVYWVLAPFIYLALGGAFLLFASLCTLYEVLSRKRWLMAGVVGLSGLVLPAIAYRYVFVIPARDAFFYQVPLFGNMPSSWALNALFVVGPVLMVLAATRSFLIYKLERQTSSHVAHTGPRAEPGKAAKSKGGHRPSTTGPQETNVGTSWFAGVLLGRKLRWVGHPFPWLAVCLGVVALLHSSRGKLLARIDYSAEQGDWPRVTELGRKLDVPDAAAISDIDRALVHQNLLLESMFEFPQRRGLEFWFNLGHSIDISRLMKSSELLFELGHVNRAERMAAESLELNGYHPRTLKQLFLISVLKGQTKTGLPFLNLLRKTLWDRGWAESKLRAIQEDPTLAGEACLLRARTNMVRQDYVGAIPDNVLMQISLRQAPWDTMSFQYLMAYYLLDCQLEKVTQNLGRISNLKLAVIPRHLQEAVVLFENLNPNVKLDLHGFAISPAIEQGYKRFNEAAARCTEETAPALLAREFGDTYWYYYIAGHSGSALPAGRPPK
jgi:hypothetical protein